jgi:hypothetical protein
VEFQAHRHLDREKPLKYLHVSKELVVVPRMALGTDGKPVIVEGEFDYALARDGSTYTRPSPKLMSRRDAQRKWGAHMRHCKHISGGYQVIYL